MTSTASTTVHLAIYDTLADWEYGHAAAHIRNPEFQRHPGRYDIATVGLTTDPVTTMAGLRITPDLALADLDPDDSAMLILPGASAWFTDAESLAPFARTARRFLTRGVPVAAICGATAGLASEGLLDDRDHTSGAPEVLLPTGYAGADRYRDQPAVHDGGLITAGPEAPVDFAREILGRLELYEPRVLDAWYRLFAHQDASAYAVLEEAM